MDSGRKERNQRTRPLDTRDTRRQVSRRTKEVAGSAVVVLCLVAVYILGQTITTATLPSISDAVPQEREEFAAAALKFAHICVDWPLIGCLYVKYHITDVVSLEGGELRAELGVYSIYRLRIATFIVYGHVGEGIYGCTHVDYVEQ